MNKFLLLLFPLYSYAAGPSLGGSLSSPPISSNAIVNAIGTSLPLTLSSLIGSTVSGTSVSVTNAITSDGGQVIITTTTGATSGYGIVRMYNSRISDVVISNAAPDVAGNVTIGLGDDTLGTVTNLEFHNVKVYGKDTAMIFHCAASTAPSWTAYFYDSLFQGTGEGAETWRGKCYWKDCIFLATNGTGGCVPFAANDDSFNTFDSCYFYNDNTSSEDLGYIGWTRSTNIFHNCIFERRKAPTGAASSLYSALENDTVNVFDHCIFKPLGATAVDTSAATPVEVRFENCYLEPATNGVVFLNNTAVTVRGGNLMKANFSTPAQVTFLGWDGSGLTNITPVITNFTAYAAGTAYTLTGSSAALTFGTTQPLVTINQAGTYLIQGHVGLKYVGATYAGAQTLTLKFRRTNNTAADLTNGSRAMEMPVLTTFTGGDVFGMPPIIYTATSGDTVTIFGILSATPSAGSVTADTAEIVAIRLY